MALPLPLLETNRREIAAVPFSDGVCGPPPPPRQIQVIAMELRSFDPPGDLLLRQSLRAAIRQQYRGPSLRLLSLSPVLLSAFYVVNQ